MHTFLDSKIMARALRKALAERGIEIGHADSLELVARQFGFDDWNILSARIEAAAAQPKLPAGWIVSGGNPDLYRLGIDPGLPGTVKIERIDQRSDTGSLAQFATLMQSIDAAAFVGRTLRVRAELRSRGAGKGALWMRVDPPDGGRYLRFDNMHFRREDGPLTNDVDWTGRSVVLDVPDGAGSIHYGVMLNGGGTLWARGFAVEEVDPDAVPISRRQLPRGPVNLGFGEPA